MSAYKDALILMMGKIAQKDNCLFVGQQVKFLGNPMSSTLELVSKNQMLEVPVMEESQMGISLGLASTGLTVITFYPRWDFLILAANQLINHVDKFQLMTDREIHLLIRVGKGSDKPLDPGHQHKGNYLEEFIRLCPNCNFYNLLSRELILDSYEKSLETKGVHVLVEYPELYYSN